MDVPPARVTHVAQGWEYDLVPTRDLGLRRRIWINRYGKPGSTLYQPYDELPDLSPVCSVLELGAQ
jgi:2-haloacid dehalogenase